MSRKETLKEEMIGEYIDIVESKNASLVGIKGSVTDETKNTFKIRTASGTKTVLKEQITFTIKKNGKQIRIEGKQMCFRSEDRIKKVR